MKTLALNDHRALVFGRDGFFLVNRHDVYIGKALETYGEYGQAEANALRGVLSEGDTVIEVGANIGSHTVGLAGKVGRRGRVYAYEPQRACHALLQSQIALNQLNHVIAIAAGCGSQAGTFWHAPYDYDQLGNFGGVSLVSEPRVGFLPVPVVTLDEAHAGERIRLIKIDVEGMEVEVLKGARRIIQDQKPILYMENDRPEQSKALIDAVQAMGYRAWWHVCPLFNPGNYFGQENNIFGIMCSFNMICFPTPSQFDANAFSGEAHPDRPHPLDAVRGIVR